MQEHNVVQNTGTYVPVHIRTVHVILERKMYNIMHFFQTYDITCIYIHITLHITTLILSVIEATHSHQYGDPRIQSSFQLHTFAANIINALLGIEALYKLQLHHFYTSHCNTKSYVMQVP